jgi:MarR-like DNA-binding transcriptional regulator SgrR of sgrS sRNA
MANPSSLLLKSEVFENLSLHLDDVEFLQNAFIAQAITGPLIRFSNRGRYEPYVAKSWTQNENRWSFKIHDGLKCENGEMINAESFARSLKGSIARFSATEIKQTPFASLSEIKADGDELELHFSQPVGKALLEYLAMTPFAYLCEANFAGKEWKSKDQFISSGPYKVAQFDASKNRVVLELRQDWPLNEKNSFQKIYLSKEPLEGIQTSGTVEMTYGKMHAQGGEENLVLEVPRALLSVRTGIQPDQYFADRNHRRALQAEINKVLALTEIPFENYHRAESFFFGQVTGHEITNQVPTDVPAPTTPLKIRARPKGERPEVDFFQGILFQALTNLKWPYELIKKPVGNVKDFFNFDYDLAFDRSHVDATLDPDFIRLLFKSKLGPRFQDPKERVSHLVDSFDRGQLSYRDFLVGFNNIIAEEAAIIPLYHRGFTWQFSPNIDVKNISPLMSILRYEELSFKPDGRN